MTIMYGCFSCPRQAGKALTVLCKAFCLIALLNAASAQLQGAAEQVHSAWRWVPAGSCHI